MITLGRVLFAHEFETLEDLLEMERLGRIDHVDRTVDVELVELFTGERQILGGVETGAVGFEQQEEGQAGLAQIGANRALGL